MGKVLYISDYQRNRGRRRLYPAVIGQLAPLPTVVAYYYLAPFIFWNTYLSYFRGR